RPPPQGRETPRSPPRPAPRRCRSPECPRLATARSPPKRHQRFHSDVQDALAPTLAGLRSRTGSPQAPRATPLPHAGSRPPRAASSTGESFEPLAPDSSSPPLLSSLLDPAPRSAPSRRLPQTRRLPQELERHLGRSVTLAADELDHQRRQSLQRPRRG